LITILLIVVTSAISASQEIVSMVYVCHVLLERQSVLVVLDSVVRRARTVVIISAQTHNMIEIIVEAVTLNTSAKSREIQKQPSTKQISIVRENARIVLQERLYAEVSV
jgi:hypothetical protein